MDQQQKTFLSTINLNKTARDGDLQKMQAEARSNIPSRYHNADIANSQYLDKIINHNYAEFLYFWGGAGSGKTYTAAAILRYAYRVCADNDFYIRCNMTTLNSIFVQLRSDISQEYRIIDKMTNKNILIVDDISSVQLTEYAIATVYQILNQRYNDMLPTIITGNWSPREIADKFGSPLASRICSGMVINFGNNDHRIDGTK